MSNPTTALGRAIDADIANDDTSTKAERAMLARLRVSGEAAEAFANLLLSGTKGLIFIRDCVVSHRYAHGEHAKQIEAFRSAPKPEKARAALAEVEHFFRGSLFETIPDLHPFFPMSPRLGNLRGGLTFPQLIQALSVRRLPFWLRRLIARSARRRSIEAGFWRAMSRQWIGACHRAG